MPIAQYELTNLSVNQGDDNGDQQIAIRPYDEVTSLNANQLIAQMAAHGPATQKIRFEQPSSDEVQIVIEKGFVGYFQDRVEHDVDGEGNIQERTYVVKVSFDDDASITRNINNLTLGGGLNFRNQDQGDDIGVDSPAHRRTSLVLQYNWEEGMLGSATAVGGGEGSGIGRFAQLRVLNEDPNSLANLVESQYKKTLFLGELLNLSEAIDGTELHADRIRFRPYDFQTLFTYENLRDANDNMRVSFNPTGDYAYINHGSVYIGSSFIQIPKGLSWRVRGVVPQGLRSTVPEEVKTPLMETVTDEFSTVHFNNAGQPVDSEGNRLTPGEEDDDIAGQYDVLVMNKHAEVGWVVRPMTVKEDKRWKDPFEFVRSRGEGYFEGRSVPQTPGVDVEDEDNHIDNPLSIVAPQLDDNYLVLLVLRREYYVNNDGYLTLHSQMWPREGYEDDYLSQWLIYEHNPLFPILTIPDVNKEMNVTDLLIIPIQKD